MHTPELWRRSTPIANQPAGRPFLGLRPPFLLLAAILLAAPGFASGGNSPSAAPEPYSMFMGADLLAEWHGALRPVRDMQDGHLVLDVDGRRVVLAAGRDVGIRIKRALKVAPAGIAVKKFEASRGYTYDNNPARSYEATLALWAQAGDQSDIQNGANNNLQSYMGLQNQSANYANANDLNTPLAGPETGATAGEYATLAAGQSSLSGDFAAEGDANRLMMNVNALTADEKGQQQFDAFSLDFEISSAQPIDGCYAVVVALLRTKADDPTTAQQRIYAQPLGRIAERPAKIRFFGGGFPKGYQLVGAEVHVYKAGVELDTTAAPKRYGLSADDAFQFAIAEYVGAHRGATLPPVAATAVRVRPAASAASGTFYLRVARNGLPLGAFTDESCTEKISDRQLADSVSGLRFYPALKAGRPVESVIPLRL